MPPQGSTTCGASKGQKSCPDRHNTSRCQGSKSGPRLHQVSTTLKQVRAEIRRLGLVTHVGRVLRALQTHDGRLAESPASFIKVYEQIRKTGGSGGSTTHETEGGHIHRQLDLKAAQQGIYAHVAAASVLGKPGQLVAVEIVVAVTRTIAVLQEEQLEGPLAEALELVPDDDGAIDSTRCGGSGSRAG